MRLTSRSLIAALLLVALSLLPVLYPIMYRVWQIATACLLFAFVVDWLWGRRYRQFTITRETPQNLPSNAWTIIKLLIINPYQRQITLSVFDHHPETAEVDQQPISVTIPRNQRALVRYKIKPYQRGEEVFSGVDLLITSPLGLWQLRAFQPVTDTVRIYPNFADVSRYALMANDQSLSQTGVHLRRRRGEGQDFRQLREYRDGDTMRQIDWKATSRQGKLVSREYQDERDQQVVFLLDCGRHMRHSVGGIAHLDRALNSMLLLGNIASRQGDAVGFLSFAGDERWMRPSKGAAVINKLLEQTYDLPVTLEAADYLAVASRLRVLQRRRALVIWLTATQGGESAELQSAIRLLSRQHMVVFADLRPSEIDEEQDKAIQSLDTALLYHGVKSWEAKRSLLHRTLSKTGAVCLDTTAEALPANLINAYLTLKRSGRI